MSVIPCESEESGELVTALAHVTGESPRWLRHRGFERVSPAELKPTRPREPDLGLICPGCGSELQLGFFSTIEVPEWAECRQCDAAFEYREDELFVVS